MSGVRIRSGETPAGSTNWQPYSASAGVFVDVDTSEAGFKTTPNYVASIAGRTGHWTTTGGSAIYSPTPNGFKVYVRYSDGRALTPEEANAASWRISWIGVEKTEG